MRVLALVLSAIGLAACQTGEFDEWRMRNDTSETVFVFWLDDGDEVRIGPIPPGLQVPLPVEYPYGCSSGMLIAKTSSGREVARRTEPLCMDDTWVIAEPTT